jgi:D-3-phosphoglycerate dehydrogenase
MKMRIQVTTHPFGACGQEPRRLLEAGDFDVHYNPFGRRIKTAEVAPLIRDCHAIVAGTEPYTPEVLEEAKDLKVISRVGVGLDNVDLQYCLDRGIEVTYTPQAPADAVAELTLAHILSLLRFVHPSDRSVREKAWNRFLGFLVRERTIGLLGLGRIGKRVARLLAPFSARLLACDLEPDEDFARDHGLTLVAMEELFASCDLVSVHVPLTPENRFLVGAEQIRAMPPGSFLVNTSRGGVMDEKALLEGLQSGQLAGAALDVFCEEPYEGPLVRLENVILSAHMGASARHSRFLMERGAAEDCVRVLTGRPPAHRAFDDGTVRLVGRTRSASNSVPSADVRSR